MSHTKESLMKLENQEQNYTSEVFAIARRLQDKYVQINKETDWTKQEPCRTKPLEDLELQNRIVMLELAKEVISWFKLHEQLMSTQKSKLLKVTIEDKEQYTKYSGKTFLMEKIRKNLQDDGYNCHRNLSNDKKEILIIERKEVN